LTANGRVFPFKKGGGREAPARSTLHGKIQTIRRRKKNVARLPAAWISKLTLLKRKKVERSDGGRGVE